MNFLILLKRYATADRHFTTKLKCTLISAASWSSVSVTVELKFKSRPGQIGHSVANGSPPMRHFFEKSCIARAQ